jgi:outer membrane phospholipase A
MYSVSTCDARLSVDVWKGTQLIEVYHVRFPRFTHHPCTFSTLEQHQQDEVKLAIECADEVVDRMEADNRDATSLEIRKAFLKTLELRLS